MSGWKAGCDRDDEGVCSLQEHDDQQVSCSLHVSLQLIYDSVRCVVLSAVVLRRAWYRLALIWLHDVGIPVIHPEIEYKKPHFQYYLFQECGFLCLISGCTPSYALMCYGDLAHLSIRRYAM
eukprot:207769-Rhodomonas_salina.1